MIIDENLSPIWKKINIINTLRNTHKYWLFKHPKRIKQLRKKYYQKYGLEYSRNLKNNKNVWNRIKLMQRIRTNMKNKSYMINIPKTCKKCDVKMLQKFDKCVYCKSKKKLSIEHIIPLSKNGNSDYNNLIIACMKCNLSKGTKNVFEWLNEKKLKIPKIIREREKMGIIMCVGNLGSVFY